MIKTVGRKSKRVYFTLVGAFVMVMVFSFLVLRFKNEDEVSAADAGRFNAGYIISDFQMSDYGSMSEAEIQNFLSSKNSCSNTDYNYYLQLAGNPNYTWHFENGHFICLSQERFGNNDNEIGFQYGESAAHIIWQAAQDYRINPKVILVLLQKETGLITDPIPNNGDYRKATGFGCPDTAACSSQYYGFKNQVRNAVALFRTVLDGGWTNYPVGDNYVQYNPNAACGGSVINIQNRATSALYRYTPYQPNAGALAAGYGTAPCGAYGNRNFYLYFEDWFGGITWDGWPDKVIVLSNNRVASAGTDLDVTYQTHIQHYGWLGWVNGGEMSGTAGYSARIEALQIKLGNNLTGIEYRTHIQGIGWTDYVRDGAISGTTGESKRVEAIQVRLTGDLARRYDVYYRTHVQGTGWTDWSKNDEISGTTGKSKRIEAIQVRIVKKDLGLGPKYIAHVQSDGWMEWAENAKLAGTTGQAKRMEAMQIRLPDGLEGDIEYRAHVQGIGWMDWVKNGETAGTTGQAKRMEAVEIELSSNLAAKYDVYYRAHVQGIGWMDWVKNGETAGTTGQAKRMEAVEIELVAK